MVHFVDYLRNPDETLKIKFKYPEHMYVVRSKEENDESDDDENMSESNKYFTFLYHSAFNLRDFHMMQVCSVIVIISRN